MIAGLRNRQTGVNSMNEHSSRSHSMLTLHIDTEVPDTEDDKMFITKHGKLTFVDLAGRWQHQPMPLTVQSLMVRKSSFFISALDILLLLRVLAVSYAICTSPVVHCLTLSIQAVRLCPGLFFPLRLRLML